MVRVHLVVTLTGFRITMGTTTSVCHEGVSRLGLAEVGRPLRNVLGTMLRTRLSDYIRESYLRTSIQGSLLPDCRLPHPPRARASHREGSTEKLFLP